MDPVQPSLAESLLSYQSPIPSLMSAVSILPKEEDVTTTQPDTSFQAVRSATPYIRSTSQGSQLKLVTMSLEDWDKVEVPVGATVIQKLFELHSFISSQEPNQQGRLASLLELHGDLLPWIDQQHLALSLDATTNNDGVLDLNPIVSAEHGVPEIVEFIATLGSLLGDLSGLAMAAMTSPSYSTYCLRRKQALNTPMPGSTVSSNIFHDTYELLLDAPRLGNDCRPKASSDCPLSYSMHIHVPLGAMSSGGETIVFPGIGKCTSLQTFQITIFHSQEPFYYVKEADPTSAAGIAALNIVARATDAVVNQRTRHLEKGRAFGHGLVPNQRTVFGAWSNYNTWVMRETVLELKHLRRVVKDAIGLNLPFDDAEQSILHHYAHEVRVQYAAFFEGAPSLESMLNDISMAKMIPLLGSPIVHVVSRSNHPGRSLLKTGHRAGSQRLDPTPCGKRSEKQASIFKALKKNTIIDAIMATFDGICSVDNLQSLISQLPSPVMHSSRETCVDLPAAITQLSSSHDTIRKTSSTVHDVLFRIGTAVAAFNSNQYRISRETMPWRVSLAALILSCLDHLMEPETGTSDKPHLAALDANPISSNYTMTKIRRCINDFFSQASRGSFSSSLVFTLHPTDVLDNPDPMYHQSVSLSGPSFSIGRKSDTVERNKARLEKQILFTMFLRKAMVQFINAIVGPRKSAIDDPDCKPRARDKTHNLRQDSVHKDSKDRLFFWRSDCKMAKEMSKWVMFQRICETIRACSPQKPSIDTYFVLEPIYKVCFYEVYTNAFIPEVIRGVCERLSSPKYITHHTLLTHYALRLLACPTEGSGEGPPDLPSSQP